MQRNRCIVYHFLSDKSRGFFTATQILADLTRIQSGSGLPFAFVNCFRECTVYLGSELLAKTILSSLAEARRRVVSVRPSTSIRVQTLKRSLSFLLACLKVVESPLMIYYVASKLLISIAPGTGET